MKCISRNNLAILFTLTAILTSVGYAIDLKKSNFKESNVILFKFEGIKYYGVIASLEKTNNIGSQVEIAKRLDLTAKKNLSQYLNKKNNNDNYVYTLKEFQKSSDCSESQNYCFAYFIKEENIEKKEISIQEKNFDGYLKEHSETLEQGVNFIDFNNKEYTVSISLVNLQDTDAAERIKRMKTADKNAEKQLSDFIHDLLIYTPEASKEMINNFSKLDLKSKDNYTSIRYISL